MKTTHPKSLLIGLLAGFGGGLFSLGGGTVTIPLMLYWLQLTEFEARGTALVAAFFPALLGTWIYQQAGQMDWLAVALIAIPALIVTPLVSLWSERLSGERLRRLFGAVVVGGALMLLLRDQLLGDWALQGTARPVYLIGIGILEGLVAGSVGVSGGPVLAPLLVLGLGMPQQLAQGCSLAARIPAVVAGGVENFFHRHIRFQLLPGLVGGGLIGAWLGSRLALALPELHLRSLFALLLAALGLHYLLSRKKS